MKKLLLLFMVSVALLFTSCDGQIENDGNGSLATETQKTDLMDSVMALVLSDDDVPLDNLGTLPIDASNPMLQVMPLMSLKLDITCTGYTELMTDIMSEEGIEDGEIYSLEFLNEESVSTTYKLRIDDYELTNFDKLLGAIGQDLDSDSELIGNKVYSADLGATLLNEDDEELASLDLECEIELEIGEIEIIVADAFPEEEPEEDSKYGFKSGKINNIELSLEVGNNLANSLKVGFKINETETIDGDLLKGIKDYTDSEAYTNNQKSEYIKNAIWDSNENLSFELTAYNTREGKTLKYVYDYDDLMNKLIEITMSEPEDD